ncbi:MAG: peptidylprolyl isomerase [candidate division KSB1 bacterium]|nr:peptidylprolyl isomerase [candidate division KSB1 bacterium]MDZ7273519.1 peptidylprolyl isomerase [candidate division KSB1 bacterium]MDZ7286890.1 peptidylprolyl isomerase [candidate division KSB1 bacterium]MDZ7299757.1 peptidylprolyl isomerase [candidate division KSB1 bacterium]MDZ7305696.1 peptidylprolyl isomerase [candidate division KSB1 bacterium]
MNMTISGPGRRSRLIFAICCKSLLLVAGTATGGWAASGDVSKDGRSQHAALLPAGSDTVVVARIGNLPLTAEEFLLSFAFGPAFVKRHDNPREHHLELMVNEKLVALAGYARGLADDPEVVSRLHEIEGDLATEELYRDDILSQIVVEQEELAAAIKKERLHLELQWLFAPNRTALADQLDQLSQGVPFDTLFHRQLNDSVLIANRSLATTRFRLEASNPEMASVVDTLPPGRPSAPIAAPDGFYLVRLTSVWTNPILTQTEQAGLQQAVQRVLRRRRAEALSERYINDLMRQQNPVIDRQTFNLLRALLGKTVLPPEKYHAWNLRGKLLSEAGALDSLVIDRYHGQSLVRLRDDDLLLGEFWTWYQNRRPYLRCETDSPQRFFVSLKQMVWRSVRDKLLIDRARQRGLQFRPAVRKQKQWWEHKLVYAKMKQEMLATVHLTDEQIKEFYRQNPGRYREQKGQIPPYEKVAEKVRQDCYAAECAKTLLRTLEILRTQYPVQVNRAALEALPDGAAPDPRAFDLITAKTGGIFPRPAIPTIDFDWKPRP